MSEFIFKLPDLGEGTVEAEIVQWHVNVGDAVNEDDHIVDVMTDKANVEVPAPVNGIVIRRQGEPGDKIAVGAELIAIETDQSGSISAANISAANEVRTSNEATRVEKTQVEKSGTEKYRLEQFSPDKQSARRVKPSDQAPVASTIPSSDANSGPGRDRVITSPAIRRQASELGIDLTLLTGSGPGGRIIQADLANAMASTTKPEINAAKTEDGVETIKLIGIRRMIAHRLSESVQTIPHFSYVEEVDISALDALRKQLKNDFPAHPLTYLPFIGCALIRALVQHPQLNARFDGESEILYRYRAVHLGIATQTPDGLKVPVIHQADQLNLWQLADAIQAVSARAIDGTARTHDLQGSTITLSSLGKLGGLVSTPVINAPEVAIVGVNKAQLQPVVYQGAISSRLIMNLSSSFDHRIIDGHDAASFIQTVKALLEQPARLFIPEC